MTWEEYKAEVKATDHEAAQAIEIAEAEAEADIIGAIIEQMSVLGINRRELAEQCGMSQSTLARIEAMVTMPRLDVLMKILNRLHLKLTVIPS